MRSKAHASLVSNANAPSHPHEQNPISAEVPSYPQKQKSIPAVESSFPRKRESILRDLSSHLPNQILYSVIPPSHPQERKSTPAQVLSHPAQAGIHPCLRCSRCKHLSPHNSFALAATHPPRRLSHPWHAAAPIATFHSRRSGRSHQPAPSSTALQTAVCRLM